MSAPNILRSLNVNNNKLCYSDVHANLLTRGFLFCEYGKASHKISIIHDLSCLSFRSANQIFRRKTQAFVCLMVDLKSASTRNFKATTVKELDKQNF